MRPKEQVHVILDNLSVHKSRHVQRFLADHPRLQKGSATPLFFGTPSYLSPELVRGEASDSRPDLFSLGCILHELVTGRPPFYSDNPMAIFYRVVHEDPEMGLIPDGHEWKRLRGVITRALQKKPEDRYPDAGTMRADLELALEELGDSADWVSLFRHRMVSLPEATEARGRPPSADNHARTPMGRRRPSPPRQPRPATKEWDWRKPPKPSRPEKK